MVFHRDFAHDKLCLFFEQWSKADPYFAHLYYWYINSLPPEVHNERAQEIIDKIINESIDENNIHLFDSDYDKFFKGLSHKLVNAEYETKIKSINERRAKANTIIQDYKNYRSQWSLEAFRMKGSDIELKPYISPFLQVESLQVSNAFTSTLLFFGDLWFAAEEITKARNPLASLKRLLNIINQAINPSCIYVPFVKDSIRNFAVLNIAVEETKIFSTKERAPYYICVELFRPQKFNIIFNNLTIRELAYEYNSVFHPSNIKKKKQESFIQWAKKKLKINNRKAKTDNNYRDFLNGRPVNYLDDQFKLSNLDDIVSKPVTLRDLRTSFSHSVPLGKQFNEVQLHQSQDQVKAFMKILIFKENDPIFLEVEEAQAPPNVTQTNPQNQAKRFISEDIHKLSITQRKNSNNSPFEVMSQENKSLKSSFSSKNISARKCPLTDSNLPKLGTEIHILEPLYEEEKGSDPSRNLDEENQEEKEITNGDTYFFGEDSAVQSERIRRQSPFGTLKTWRLVHLIIKSGADMKEEQFAIQLISKFDHIFKLENLKLVLSPYEILSLGQNVGLVEVIKDAITISKLKEKIYTQNIPTLNVFFAKYYGKNVDQARKMFCRSLAAYSLVCYLLQIKDRHNGNIMLHKEGHIIHIDFGFFLTNSPGKGIEFERKIPFKLLNEYIEVLGGHRSKLFQKFRKLFYKGFLAARRHREQILILVKMVYSSQSQNFPCFKAGIKTIQELEQRFCPPNIQEKDLKQYCYNLINQSLDNWRAKCYDKYQYYFQGILY